ncbi:hypothetical protein K6U21_14575, partial [Vibrio vulnificus]|uniref:hypothetical protein n=1 Tax=Vibrio vulnificus TaxID=672 RepID=UPI001EEC7684
VIPICRNKLQLKTLSSEAWFLYTSLFQRKTNMEMIIVSSEQQKRLIMIFTRTASQMSDKALLSHLSSYSVNSSVYPAFKAALDLRVERIKLPFGDDRRGSLEGGDFLYRYLSRGYICLGDFTGQPKPDLSQWGVRSVRKLPKVGFGL